MAGDYGLSSITPYSFESLGDFLKSAIGTAPTSQSWIGANRGAFFPFVIATPMQCKKVFWSNGTAVAGTIDAGVYTADQKLVVSAGPTTQAGTSVVQEVDVTDTVIPQGLNFLAISGSSTSATLFGRNTSAADMIRSIDRKSVV